MEISKLTSKYQATIPAKVRDILGLGKGDAIAFRIDGKKVVLDKATPIDRQFARLSQSALNEWNSADDDNAFKHL